jgi:predicted PurR-regulated permease PerM
MKDFINNHRKLVMTIFIAIVVILGIAIYTINSNTKTVTTSFDQNTQTGDSDASASIRYVNMLYTITQSSTDPTKVTINSFSGYRNAAVNKIYQLGLNPTDFKITFNYESPFMRYE